MPAIGDQHKNAPANPFEEPKTRISEYTARELAVLQSRLERQLGPEFISTRKGPGGKAVHYIASDKVIGLANEVFGFNGWSSAIRDIQIDFIDENTQTKRVDIGLSVVIRVTLRDGTYHEDIGYGHIENCSGKAAAFEKAKKEGTTDALKRALRNFGNVLGNCVYDKEYLGKVTKIKVKQRRFAEENLYRHQDFTPKEHEGDSHRQDIEPEVAQMTAKDSAGSGENSEGTSLKTDEGEFASADFDEADFSFSEFDHPDAMSVESAIQTNRPQHQPAQQAQPRVSAVNPNGKAPQSLPPQRQQQQQPPNQGARPGIPTTQSFPPPARPNNARPSPAMNPPANPPRPRPVDISSGNQVAPNRAGPVSQAQGLPPKETFANPPTPSMPPEQPVPAGAPKGFVPSRNAEAARAAATPLPAFNPQAESPSIRRTAGFDHTKSVSVTRTQVPWNSTGANAGSKQSAQQDAARRVGAPQAHNSPLANRGQFKPVGKRAAEGAGLNTQHQIQQQDAATRQALGDVTVGAVNAPRPLAQTGPPDPKKPRLESDQGQPTNVNKSAT